MFLAVLAERYLCSQLGCSRTIGYDWLYPSVTLGRFMSTGTPCKLGLYPRLYLWRTYHTFTDKCLKCLLPRVVTGVISISRCLFAVDPQLTSDLTGNVGVLVFTDGEPSCVRRYRIYLQCEQGS